MLTQPAVGPYTLISQLSCLDLGSLLAYLKYWKKSIESQTTDGMICRPLPGRWDVKTYHSAYHPLAVRP